MSRLLPTPGSCSWLEATDYADVLERLANHLDRTQGPQPPRFTRLRGEWEGRRRVIRYIRVIVADYRHRANRLAELSR